MNDQQKELFRAIAAVLQEPRNKMGKIGWSHDSDRRLRTAADALGLKIPHGGLDPADQCAMYLQALVGDEPKSIVQVR